MPTTTENAYAKINLFLDVISKREDGFHNIQTVMQTVSLCDSISVSAAPSEKTKITLSVTHLRGDFLPEGEDNLAYRAADTYLNASGICAEVDITLIKRIPIAAGLGGGSSDAAAVLRAMNRIFGTVDEKTLLSLATALGSDVPFCLVGGCKVCEGRGEIIQPLSDCDADGKMFFVIISPSISISTPKAYAELDTIYGDFQTKKRRDFVCEYSDFISALANNKTPGKILYNVFEECPHSFTDEVKKAKLALSENGALCALMSGSGPACFGIFKTKNEAERACEILNKQNIKAYYAESI